MKYFLLRVSDNDPYNNHCDMALLSIDTMFYHFISPMCGFIIALESGDGNNNVRIHADSINNHSAISFLKSHNIWGFVSDEIVDQVTENDPPYLEISALEYNTIKHNCFQEAEVCDLIVSQSGISWSGWYKNASNVMFETCDLPTDKLI